MTLGDAEAQHLGVNTERIRQLAMLLSAVMVGAAVSFAGIIGFIGLVIPHLMRLLFGPDHRIVLPSSLLGGAIFLVAADMIGRSLPGPSIESGITVEVPVGVLTALVGGPFFLFLILFTQKRRGR
jgi:iron complex transport system permease protein